MNTRYDESARFLEWLRPGGPWVLSAIEVDRKGIRTNTLKTAPELLKWLEKWGATRNIYYSVNPLMREVAKKAEREDIAALALLHVDIDPRAGEELGAERDRALSLLNSPPGDVPKPSCVIFSGGGFNALWKLDQPLPIDGDVTKYEEAKLWNLQLERVFGADHCHNVDRILRLPGTLNRPDSKKRAKGRQLELARIEWMTETTLPLSAFRKAVPTQRADSGFASTAREPKISGNIRRLGSVDELGSGVPDWCKVVIVQGRDPDNPQKFGSSRSEWLFAVCCELVRRGIDDETIYAVITDPDFMISASVLDKGSATHRYALRQIEQAKEDAIDPWLRKLNARHAVVANCGGKCLVVEEVWDHALKRPKLTRQTFGDFKNRYCNERVLVGQTMDGKPAETAPLGSWWLVHPQRRQYDTIVFSPGGDVENAYNLWRGFSCEALPGDCTLLLAHIMDNVCRGVQEYYDYLMGWMARAVQQPDLPGYSAIVMRGKQGTGKSFLAKTFGSLFGCHFLQVADPKFLVGSFNSHLRNCVVLFGDEAFYAGDRKHESVLKSLITEEFLTIEAKGVDAEAAQNCVHLMMASNAEWVVPAATDDRRFFVLDVSDERARDSEYFRAIQAQLDSGGREAFLHLLSSLDLTSFDVRHPPKTEALRVQKELSLGPEEEWWHGKLLDGRVLAQHADWHSEVLTAELLYDFQQTIKKSGRSAQVRLGKFLARACPWVRRRRSQGVIETRALDGHITRHESPYYYWIPSLSECRAHWDGQFGGPYAWPTAAEIKVTAPEQF